MKQIDSDPRNRTTQRQSLLAHNFTRKESNIDKKRSFNETFTYSRQTPDHTSYHNNFDDSSTVRPNQNTIIRNPTLLPGFGQEKQHLNRSHHVQPVNLSRLQFDDQVDADINQRSQYATTPLKSKKPLFQAATQKVSDFTSKEIAEHCFNVSVLLNEMMTTESDLTVSDISLNQSQGRQYEIVPELFAVTNQFKLPAIIKRELDGSSAQTESFLDYGFLQEGTAYFCFGKLLYLWRIPTSTQTMNLQSRMEPTPQKFEFDQIITSIYLGTHLPGMDSQHSDKVLIVATITEIRIFYYVKNQRDLSVELIDSKFKIATDSNVVQKIIQLRKNGRIFYGGSSGHVIELKYEDRSHFDVFSLMQGERRKLKKNDHQSENIIKKFLPGFLKFSNQKSLVDIKVDEYRNVIYSVSMSLDQDTLNQSVIEVFDLGLLSNKFEKITTIKQHQIVEMMLEFWQKDISIRKADVERIVADYKIINVAPISSAESQNWHLLLITQNGYRVYLHFDLVEAGLITTDELRVQGANVENILNYKFSNRWRIEEIMHFPELSSLQDLSLINRYQGTFSGGSLQSAAQGLLLDHETISYYSGESMIAFVGQQSADVMNVDANDKILLNFIKKNESTIAYNRQVQEAHNHSQYCKMVECFSQLYIPFQRVITRNQTPGTFYEDNYDITNENVIGLQFNRRAISSQVQDLIAIDRTYLQAKGQNATPKYEIESLSEFEKQVYLQPNKLTVLTDNRVIEVQEVRPIDMVAMMIHSMTDNKFLHNLIDVFEEFLDCYTVRETCSMLLQIHLEESNCYLYSKKISDGFIYDQKKSQQQGQPSQILSKSTQIFKNRRGSQILGHSGYQPKNEYADIVRIRRITPEERMMALQLLTKYGDSIIDIRQHPDISEDSLEGVPSNMQDFSIKHYALYQYLQRLLRPLWDVKLAHKLPTDQEAAFRPTFGSSISITQTKLRDLQTFITRNEQLLYGEVFELNVKQNEKFVRNTALLNMVFPVHELKSNHKSKLEILEKNSLKNLKLFITRCIQAIEIVTILTYNGDEKMFAQVQKAINDKSVINKFAETLFKDLVIQDNCADIVRILEASVQVETQDQQESQALMKQRLFQIQKTCDTYFQKHENVTIIGTSLLKAAKGEKFLPRKEELLKQAIDSLSSQPLNIDLNVVPQLLIDNGNYTSLADLTLRKIRALQQMTLNERSRIMSDIEYEAAISQCQAIILSLFAAIDASITKDSYYTEITSQQTNDYVAYFLNKLNAVTNNEIKVNLRDKILRRVEQFNDEILLLAIFDLLLSKPSAQLLIDTLPTMNKKLTDQLFEKMLKSEKIQRIKFENMTRIFMKRGDVERLCILTIKAVNNGFQLYSKDIIEQLQIDRKMSLIGTALAVLSDHKIGISSELSLKFDRELRLLEDQLENQLIVIGNIQEVEDIITLYIGNNPQRKELEESHLSRLDQFKKQLSFGIFSQDQLIKLCDTHSLYESILRIKFLTSMAARDDQLRYLMQNIISFYADYGQLQSELLFKKVQMFKGNKQQISEFLKLLQSAINKRCQKQDQMIAAYELDQLFKQYQLINTRWCVIEFCFNNLMNDLTPSKIYRLLTVPQNQFEQNQDQFLSWPNLVLKFGIIKFWVQRNNQLFGEGKVGQESSIEQRSFKEDLVIDGQKIYREEFIKIMDHLTSNDLFIQLPKEEGNLLKANIESIKSEFLGMLDFHGIPQSQQEQQQRAIPVYTGLKQGPQQLRIVTELSSPSVESFNQEIREERIQESRSRGQPLTKQKQQFLSKDSSMDSD